MVDQQLHTPRHPVGGRPRQLAAQQPGRRVHAAAEPGAPRPAVAAPEAVLEQQDQMGVVRVEHAVVEALAVVGIRPGVEQQAGQRRRVGVVGLGRQAALAAAERSGEGRERRCQPVPEVAGVRVGAGGEQQPGRAENVRLRHPGVEAAVGEVEQRRPPERPALAPGGPGIGREEAGDRGGVCGGRGGVDARRREVRVLGEDRPRLRPPVRPVDVVGEAGEPEEVVGRIAAAGRIRVPGQRVDPLDVADQPGPAGEAVETGQDELRGRQPEAPELRRCGNAGGVVLGHERQGVRVAGPGGSLQVPGPVAQLAQVGVLGQGNGRHGGLLPHACGPLLRQKGGRTTRFSHLRWARPFPRTRVRPARPHTLPVPVIRLRLRPRHLRHWRREVRDLRPGRLRRRADRRARRAHAARGGVDADAGRAWPPGARWGAPR